MRHDDQPTLKEIHPHLITTHFLEILNEIFILEILCIFSKLTPLTFLENMFRSAKHMVAESALNNPVMLNESSVSVAMMTPPIIGVNDMYT